MQGRERLSSLIGLICFSPWALLSHVELILRKVLRTMCCPSRPRLADLSHRLTSRFSPVFPGTIDLHRLVRLPLN